MTVTQRDTINIRLYLGAARVLSRVGAADHTVTPQAPWTGSGWGEHSYGGFR